MSLDIKEYFNKHRRDYYWGLNKERYQRFFKRKIIDLKNAVDMGTSEEDLKLDTYRWLGYMGIGTQAGLSLSIRTKDSIDRREKLGDHVIGTVEIGRHIHRECEKHNWDYEYLTNIWLYENLWIWGIIQVSKHEHRTDNINKDANTIDEKRFLKHYINVSDFYESKRNGKKIILE